MDAASETSQSDSPQQAAQESLRRAFELRRDGQPAGATSELESALSAARTTPYELEFETRVRLGLELAELYVATGEQAKAHELLVAEAAFAENINRFIQLSGTLEQKRTASTGWIQLRDRAAQVALVGQPAPELVVREWVLGDPVTLAELRGRVVLLEFWATWCTPCVETFSKLQQLQDSYGARGLTIVALTRLYSSASGPAEAQAAELEVIRSFIQGRGLQFSVGVSEDESTQRLYGAAGMPTVVLIDRQGRVRSGHFGAEGPGFLDALQRCLDE